MARQFKPGQLQTGSLFNISSSYALTASFALNGGGGGSSFPHTGSARITGSLVVTGSAIISGSLAVTGSVRASAGFTGSLQGNATTATNATFADSATNSIAAGYATLAAAPAAGNWIPAKVDPSTRRSPYSLGSPDAFWDSLYVGHGTIYFLSESIGGPTKSSSLSVEEDADGSTRFVLGTKDATGLKKEVIISDKGASSAVSASIAATASYIDPTYISQSAAASGFGGGSISYISSSNNPLSEIEVADYDNNVAVTYVNGRLKFIFGTPTTPSAPVASFNSTFATDRFNKVTDAYTVTGTIAVGGYTLISASLYTGSVLLTSTGSNATQLLYSTTTSGSQTYVLHVTASSPLDNSLNIQSTSLTGSLSKTNPGSPTITPTVTVQLGSTSNQIEQGATGSITFTSASGTANSWIHNFTSTNVTSPIFVTGSATGSSSITATATSYYSSSGVLGADNFPASIITSTNSFTYTKIRSVRYGASAATSFTSTQLENLATWDTTIGGTIGRVVKGTTNPHTYQFTITTSGQYIYIVVDTSYSLTGILNVNNSNSNDLGVFTATTIGNYKVYRSNNISATTILYELRTS